MAWHWNHQYYLQCVFICKVRIEYEQGGVASSESLLSTRLLFSFRKPLHCWYSLTYKMMTMSLYLSHLLYYRKHYITNVHYITLQMYITLNWIFCWMKCVGICNTQCCEWYSAIWPQRSRLCRQNRLCQFIVYTAPCENERILSVSSYASQPQSELSVNAVALINCVVSCVDLVWSLAAKAAVCHKTFTRRA